MAAQRTKLTHLMYVNAFRYEKKNEPKKLRKQESENFIELIKYGYFSMENGAEWVWGWVVGVGF